MKTTLRSLISLVLVAFSGISSFAQWSGIARIPGGAIDECYSFSLHGKGYVGGGSDEANFYQYDTTANTWTLKGNSPGNKWRGSGFAFALNGKGYVGCGDTTDMDQPCADMWMYNDTTNTWTQKTSFPGGSRDALFAFAIGDTGYAGGGFQGGYGMNDFYKYNPFTDTWTALPSLPFGSVGFPVAFTIGNKGYVATGQIGSMESTDLWEFDAATGAWTAKASYPGPAKQAAFGFAINNYGYVGGGMAQYDTTFYDMWRYDPVANAWYSAPTMPSAYAAWSSAFTVGNTAYVGTGSLINTVSLIATDSFRVFRGVTNPSLSVTTVNTGEHLVISPNPAGDYFSVSGIVGSGSDIILYDIAGKEMKTFTGNQNDMYIGDLPAGVYMLRCICTTGIYTEKLVKK